MQRRNGPFNPGVLELEILSIVWSKNNPSGITVKEVFDILYKKRQLAYTTIMTVMTRLANKGVLNKDKRHIPYLYTCVISREVYAKKVLGDLSKRLGYSVTLTDLRSSHD